MVVASILGGLSNAAMDLGIQGAMAAHTPLSDRAAAMAGWNSLTGMRGMIAAMAASVAVQAGLVDVTTALAAVPRAGDPRPARLPRPAGRRRGRQGPRDAASAGRPPAPDAREALDAGTVAA